MKEKVQVFGRFLSGMVMPNIGAFIAWGLITALFIETGWLPNENFAKMVSPMSSVLLPLLIAYTGGEVVAGKRGGVIGTIAAMGVIAGSDVPMFIGAMVVGPLSAWIIKKFDKAVEGRIKAGFEMLVNNFSLGIIGALLALVSMAAVTPLVSMLNQAMSAGVGFFVDHGILPLTSLFIEPAKVLFLNNAINHGILSPMGIQQVEQTGKSIFFLLEANPGPGLGILLAYCLVGKGSAKSSAPGAAIIHFFGGIHEIYFPYILMNPFLLLAVIAGGASGVFCFTLFQVGLTSAASPGSFLAIMMMAERHSYLGIIIGVAVAAAVSFVIALPLLKFMGRDTSLEEAQQKKDAMKRQAKGIKDERETQAQAPASGSAAAGRIKKIAFACDAGMGSSAMGATVLKKKLTAAGLAGIEVIHTPVSSIPADVQIVVTHQELGERASHSNPNARLVLITNFLAAPEYEGLVEDVKKQNS
ncbi:PTS mannitol transporter subunit IICB [Otoolea muris]|uniref:PTS mannitol transporter subunit IICB n=1 Tax=Otoolea muris TaxID=2941515 RepID=UPI00203A935C|nr:PTS mannitol transporter subunit IICBA [Otoolea muris]